MNKQLKFLHDMSKKQYFNLFLLFLSTGLFVFLTLLQSIIFGFVIDNIVNQEAISNQLLEFIANLFGGVDFIRDNLWVTAVMMIIIALVSSLMVFCRSRLNGIISENVAFNIKNKLFDHFMHVPYKYYVSSKTGDLIQRGTSDIDTIRRVFGGQISEFFYAMLIVIISFIIMINKNIKLAAIAASLLPFIFIFALIFFKRVRKDFLEFEDSESELTAAISENLAATRVIKAFNREAYEYNAFKIKNRNMSNSGIKVINSLSFYWGVSDFMCFASILLVLMFGTLMVINNEISVGDALVFLSYQGMMVWPLRHMGRIIADMSKVDVATRRIVEVIEEPLEDLDEGKTPTILGDIELKNVKFQYHDDPYPVLNGVDMSIKAGESVAILGPTGAGKSSLIHLLMGLYDYTDGSITLNGNELKDISKRHLRENVAIVLQEPFLFSKTVKENIVISRPTAGMDQIERAANIANVDEFIHTFDLGYETMVGEKGATLSGGQKQRVAIARTVVNEYPIIIFDDSLSAVDTETDASIRSKLANVKEGTTTIIITQRIASSETADKIFVIEDGVITQSGNHNQLIQEEGLYKRVYEVQSKKNLGDNHGK